MTASGCGAARRAPITADASLHSSIRTKSSDFFKLQSVALDRPTMAFAALPEHKARADIGVTGKWQFRTGREYPHLRCILGPLRRQHEGRLSQVELSRNGLHLPRGQSGSVGHNGKRVATELPISEHIDGYEFHLHVAVQF